MKKLIDKKFILITGAILLLGIISGIIFLIFTSALDKLIIKEEIENFFDIISLNQNATLTNLLTSFKYNIIYITFITISSIIYIFSPFILLINFYKGFLIGFFISSIVLTYKLKGIIYALLAIFPHHILMCILIIIYSCIMINFSYKLMKATYKGENINLKTFIQKIGILFIIAILSSLLISILEIYLSPIFIRLIL